MNLFTKFGRNFWTRDRLISRPLPVEECGHEYTIRPGFETLVQIIKLSQTASKSPDRCEKCSFTNAFVAEIVLM
jgi:hypothetical protein